MKLPTIKDYCTALQKETFAFSCEDLRRSRVERKSNSDDVQIWAGGFAVTFRVCSGENREAVRCFWNSATGFDEAQKRYALISANTQLMSDPAIAPPSYQLNGVRTFSEPNRYWPIVRMKWIEGDHLSEWVRKWHVRADPTEIRTFTDRFLQVMERLGQLGIAHGDLQHGNILVRPDTEIGLVDYDGMFVPGMHEAGLHSRERGHRNYQHPARDREFNDRLDRFSSMVIVTALRTLEADRAAWDQFSNHGDNLLFVEEDFNEPDRPDGIFTYISKIPAVSELGARLREIARGPFTDIPTLAEFLQLRTPLASVPSRQRATTSGPSGTFIGVLFGEGVLEAPFVTLQNPGSLDLSELPGLRARLAHRLTDEQGTNDIQWVYQSHAEETVDAGEAVQGTRRQGINPYRTADHSAMTEALEPDWLARFTARMNVEDVPHGYWQPGAVLPRHEDFLVRLYASYHEFRLNGLHLGNGAFASYLVGIHRRMVGAQVRLVHFEDLEALRTAQAALLAIYNRPDWDQGRDSETVMYLRRVRNRWWSTPGARWSW